MLNLVIIYLVIILGTFALALGSINEKVYLIRRFGSDRSPHQWYLLKSSMYEVGNPFSLVQNFDWTQNFWTFFSVSYEIFQEECTYSFERSLNDDKIFSFNTKLTIMFIFRALQIYNLLLNIRYFLFWWRRNQSFSLKKKSFYRSMNVQNCKYIQEDT